MNPKWNQSIAFPIIASIIRREFRKRRQWITHREITERLSQYVKDKKLITGAHKQRSTRCSKMIAWFSQRITVNGSQYKRQFDRKKIAGTYAYKPKKQRIAAKQNLKSEKLDRPYSLDLRQIPSNRLSAFTQTKVPIS